jgi:hypothetical protein
MSQTAICEANGEIVMTRAQRRRAQNGTVDNPPVYPEIRIPAAEFRAIQRAARTFSEAISLVRHRTAALGLRYDLPFYSRVESNGDFTAQNTPSRKYNGNGAYV